MIDIHTHILPAVDDGPRLLADSISMCRCAAADGVSRLVATPHWFSAGQNPTVAQVRSACEELRRAILDARIDLEIGFAGEVHLVEALPRHVAEGDVPTLDRERRYLLLEPPREGDLSAFLCQAVFDLRLNDITPVIAHPELTQMFRASHALAERVVAMGAVLQVTAASAVASLANKNGGIVSSWLRSGLVHVLASDAHDPIHRPPLLSPAWTVCEQILGRQRTQLLLHDNPSRILAGKDLADVPPLSDGEWHADRPSAAWLSGLLRKIGLKPLGGLSSSTRPHRHR
jgi:protein-tyrosine phosphatase